MPVLPDATVCAGDVAVVGTSAFAVHGAPPGAALSRATLPASVASPVATLLGAPPMLIHALGGRVFTTEPGGPAGAQFRLFDASTGTELAPVLPSRGGRGFDVAGDWIYFVSVTDGVYAIRWR